MGLAYLCCTEQSSKALLKKSDIVLSNFEVLRSIGEVRTSRITREGVEG